MRKLACTLTFVLIAAVSAIAQAPVQPIRVGQNVAPPKKIKDVRPVYPPIAQSAHVQGVVILETTIGPDGRVQDARVLRSIPLLDAAALEAVRQWEFTPTTLNGQPVPVIMTVTVNFTLDELIPRSCADEPSMRSPENTAPTRIQFINQTDAPRKVHWLDGSGARHWMLTVPPNEMATQTTFTGHTWVVTDEKETCSAVFVADGRSTHAMLTRIPPPVGLGAPTSSGSQR